MKKFHPSIAVFAILAVSAILAGCSSDSPTGPSTDQQYFEQVIAGSDAETQDLFTSDTDALDESADLSLVGVLFQKELAAAGSITPVKFGRSITRVRRSLAGPATMHGDTLAIVHIQEVITGQFVIKALTATGITTIRKPFTETLHRDVRFERAPDKDGKHLFDWKVVAASIVNGGTTPPSTAIQSVELITPVDTFVVTNPDEYFMATKNPWKIKMPKLKDVPITLRVTLSSSSPDTEVVALHHLVTDEGLRKRQFALVSQTGGGGQFTRVYEQTWFTKIKAKKKFGHLVISVLSHASVYDDNPQLYASTIWGIPYLPGE